MQDTSQHAVDIHTPFDKRFGNSQRMGDVVFAAQALLASMRNGGHINGMVELHKFILAVLGQGIGKESGFFHYHTII